VVVVGETDVIPERVLVPDQPPDAVQLVASLEDHESADDWPDVIDVGSADRDTLGGVTSPGGTGVGVGVGGTDVGVGVEAETATEVDFTVVPPSPEQLREYGVVVVGQTDVFPERVLVPDQPPDAVQLVASLEDHESSDDWPGLIDVGFAERDSVGGVVGFGVSVGVLETVTNAEADAEPPQPLQVSS
jgi:hypothetical protein